MIQAEEPIGARGKAPDDVSNSSVSRRILWAVLGATAALVTVVIVLIVWLGGSTARDSDVQPSGDDPAWAEIAAQVPLDSDRLYSDEELGIFGLIDDVIFSTPSYIEFRTVDEFIAADNERHDYISFVASGYERERLVFERDIDDAIRTAYIFLPPDLGEGGRLELAFVEAMRECAAEAGFPGINPMGGSDDEYAHWETEYGLTFDDFLDLRHECAQYAADYPTLDQEVRDRLLNRMREHYLRAVHDYILQYEVAEISVE